MPRGHQPRNWHEVSDAAAEGGEVREDRGAVPGGRRPRRRGHLLHSCGYGYARGVRDPPAVALQGLPCPNPRQQASVLAGRVEVLRLVAADLRGADLRGGLAAAPEMRRDLRDPGAGGAAAVADPGLALQG